MSAASERLNFIYVRVPRTGSTTLTFHMDYAFGDLMTDKGGMHETAQGLRHLWGEDKWNNAFTFGFIRNPWDWLVSMYNSGVAASASEQNEPWPGAPIEPIDTPGIHPGQRMGFTFDEYVRARITTPLDWLCDDDGIMVKHVWRFEELRDFSRAKKNCAPRTRVHYRDWYTTELADHVALKFKREIEYGKYEF